MTDGVRPPRPGTGVTEDGRRLQVLTTYTRRGSRLTPTQRAAWDRHVDEWLIPESAVDAPSFDPVRWFGREAPLVVEIGSGNGEAVAAMAAARPSYDVLAFEVWRPGVASTFLNLEESGATNVRLLSVDAVWCLEHLFAPGRLAALWTFFPDPWHKQRHHKRRLVTPGFAALAASRLTPGAEWRLATDWPDYAEQIEAVLDGEPLLEGGPVERWAERPVTKFERRGLAEGRPVADFCYQRVR
ncbi:MAG TPA: tRNA (guanosine(46)-N7)-methyltransferase TrmB [Marmoricola sp.]|nr:tRNA (guanosine(46)-N7)-methyltransferase TrmB [Marmoricola sp.]